MSKIEELIKKAIILYFTPQIINSKIFDYYVDEFEEMVLYYINERKEELKNDK